MKRFFQSFTLLTLSTSILAACSTPMPMGHRNPNMRSSMLRNQARLNSFSQAIKPIKSTLPKAKGQRDVTMFSYVAMDDHLTQVVPHFLNAIESKASKNGYFLAFADLQGPDNSLLTYMQNDNNPQSFSSATSPLNRNNGATSEVSSNNPAVVTQTINWAYSQYPGRLKVFDILAHGGGYFGIGTDEHQVGQERQIMSVPQFANAVKKGLKGRKLDVLNMLSCLMGNVEAIYELRDAAKVIIASEDSVQVTENTIIHFTSELTRLSSQRGISAKQIGRQMSIFGAAKNPQSGYFTIAAYDMARIGQLKTSINRLSNTLIRALPAHKQQIRQAYDSVPELTNSPGTGQRDLWNFMNQLYRHVPNQAVKQEALNVKRSLEKFMIHSRDKEGANAHGLSIFMPATRSKQTNMPPSFGQIKNIGYLQTRFAKDTSWDKFIKTFLNSLRG